LTTQIIFPIAYKPFFGVKILNADPGSGMKRIRIRDGIKLVSGINIPDPQQCSLGYEHIYGLEMDNNDI
jgi:hypothetical protein